MSAPQSPLSCLLAWLTVSVLLISSGPSPRQGSGNLNPEQQARVVSGLAKSFVSLTLAQAQGAPLLPFSKVTDQADLPFAALSSVPNHLFDKPLQRHASAPDRARPPSLVGMIELRV